MREKPLPIVSETATRVQTGAELGPSSSLENRGGLLSGCVASERARVARPRAESKQPQQQQRKKKNEKPRLYLSLDWGKTEGGRCTLGGIKKGGGIGVPMTIESLGSGVVTFV